MGKAMSELERCAKAHRGGWRMDLMVSQCKRTLTDAALQQEVDQAILSLTPELAAVGRQELSTGLAEPLLTFSLALCTCRRGTGGRQRKSNPTKDANIDPLKAEHIMKKRQTAGLSKFKQKVAGLLKDATEAGLVGCSAADLGLVAPAQSAACAQPAGSGTDPSSSQQQAPATGMVNTDMAVVSRMLRGGAACQQQEGRHQREEGGVSGAALAPYLPAAGSASFEDVWMQLGDADAQQQSSSAATSYLGCADPGPAQQQAQEQCDECDLSWLLEESGDVPCSPTLDALLQLEIPPGTPCAGAAWSWQQQPTAGGLQPLLPPAATGTGALQPLLPAAATGTGRLQPLLPAAATGSMSGGLPAAAAATADSLPAEASVQFVGGALMLAPLVPCGAGLAAGTATPGTGGVWPQGFLL